MAEQYEQFASFAQWSANAGQRRFDVVDRAFAGLNVTIAAAPNTNVVLANKQSLLQAALHTGAVEGMHRMNRGVTLTALNNVLDWERVVDDAEGEDARRQVSAALDAYDYAVDAAREVGATPISEKWICDVHVAACAAQHEVAVQTPAGRQTQPFERGVYKQHANHVRLQDGSVHYYCPPGDVPAEMSRFIDELRTDEFASAHPVTQAAYAHHSFTWIHPFQDGNGRVSRVLASVPLLRAASIPFHVYDDQVAEYFNALSHADSGDTSKFLSFVADRATDLAQFTDDRLAIATFGASEVSAIDADRAATIAKAAERLDQLVRTEVETVVAAVEVPSHLSLAISEVGFNTPSADSFVVHLQQHVSVRITGVGVYARTPPCFPVMVCVDDAAMSPDAHVLGVDAMWTERALRFKLADVHPEVTKSVRNRVAAFVERSIREAIINA